MGYEFNFYSDYYIIFVFFCVSGFLSLLLFSVTYILNTGSDIQNYEKLSAYECGFDPIEDSRNELDMKFYKVAILFIIFDIEIVFLFPWSIVLTNLQSFSFFLSWIFLSILLIGLYLEYNSKSLDW